MHFVAVEITEKGTDFVQVNKTEKSFSKMFTHTKKWTERSSFCASELNGEAFQPGRPKVNGLEQKVVTWEKNHITYIPYNGMFAYLSVILDAYTKQVLSYVLRKSLEIDLWNIDAVRCYVK